MVKISFYYNLYKTIPVLQWHRQVPLWKERLHLSQVRTELEICMMNSNKLILKDTFLSSSAEMSREMCVFEQYAVDKNEKLWVYGIARN